MMLPEIASRLNLENDILVQMDFKPAVSKNPVTMNWHYS
jgi:acyl CoA:acetate/3-ketoacid CoA transferase